MSVIVMGMVFKYDLPTTDKMVALCLADHASDDGTRVFPSVAHLAKKASLGTTATRQALRRLQGCGLLIQTSAGGGRGNPAEYRFDMQRLANPTESVAFTKATPDGANPTPDDAQEPETQHLTSETQRIGVAEPLEPSVTTNRQETSLASPSSKRQPDLIFEALFSLETAKIYGPETSKLLTPSARATLNKAVAEVKATGVDPGDLVQAISAWPTVMGDATCTANAVAKHLPRLLAAAEGNVARARQPSDNEKVLADLRRRREQKEAASG